MGKRDECQPPQARYAGTGFYRLLQRCPAGWKLLALLVLSSALVLIRDPLWLMAGALCSLLCWLALGKTEDGGGSAGIQGRMTSLLWFMLMLGALGALTAWQSGWMMAFGVVARLIAMILLAWIVMRTTTLTAMMAVVEKLLAPLGRIGWVRPDRVALALGMMIRFLPVLKEQWDEIQQAQAARGVKVHFYALLIPMLVRTLRRAEEVAQALDARGMAD